MKIALCQINPTVGAIKQNKQLILDSYSEAINLGAELVVFPELALIGYPPQDLLLRKQFIINAELALNEINLTWGVNNVTILEFDFSSSPFLLMQ